MHYLISLLDIIFHSMNLQDPLEEATRPHCLIRAPNASPPLLPLPLHASDNTPQIIITGRINDNQKFPRTNTEALRLFALGGTNHDALCYLQVTNRPTHTPPRCNFCTDLQHSDHYFFRKSKSVILEKREK